MGVGGRGSGRHWHWGTKATVTELRSLDVRRWARDGLLEPGRSFGWHWTRDGERVGDICVHVASDEVRFDYRTRDYGGDWEPMNYPVRLLRTDCHLGGARVWLRCPALGCGRRVALLYGGKVFACRHCHQLAYPSQRERPFERYQRRAEKIMGRLGWSGEDDRYLKGKPKGMHWKTYHRLVGDLDSSTNASNAAFLDHYRERFGDLSQVVP